MITVIHDLAERVAIAAVTKAHGPVDEKFQARFVLLSSDSVLLNGKRKCPFG